VRALSQAKRKKNKKRGAKGGAPTLSSLDVSRLLAQTLPTSFFLGIFVPHFWLLKTSKIAFFPKFSIFNFAFSLHFASKNITEFPTY
jgi:hypothetical protein